MSEPQGQDNGVIVQLGARLTTAERTALAEHETAIDKHLASFLEAGRHLFAIRDNQLYRETYQTFEDYCQERWGFTDRRARQLMSGAAVGTVVPVRNEAQARELTPLLRDGEEAVREAWEEAQAEHGDAITAAGLREVVRRRQRQQEDEERKLRNALGGPLGGPLRSVKDIERNFSRRQERRVAKLCLEGIDEAVRRVQRTGNPPAVPWAAITRTEARKRLGSLREATLRLEGLLAGIEERARADR